MSGHKREAGTKSCTRPIHSDMQLWFIVPASVLWLFLYGLCGWSQYRYERVKLVRVVDGDTVRLDIEFAPDFVARNKSCRLLRIDAPEMREPAGPPARDALIGFLRGKKLTAEVRGVDNFGRWLIELLADGQNVSDWMVENGYARRR